MTTQSVARALGLLELVAAAGQAGVRELALRSGLTRSTVHRLLANLEQLGYVEQTGDRGRYRLTLKLYSLGCQAGALGSLRRAARPAMEHLAAQTGESVNLGMLEGASIVYIDRLESRHTLRTVVRLGERVPFHGSAIGKVIAAHLTPDLLQWMLDQTALEPFTADTLTDRERLREHLAAVAAQGFATNLGEHDPNIVAVAAPIFAFDGNVLAGISVSAPSIRLDATGLQSLAPLVRQAAEAVSRRLGQST